MRGGGASSSPRHERGRSLELEQQLTEARKHLAEQVAARVAGEQESGRANEQLERCTRECAQAEQALATSSDRLKEAEAEIARERDERQAVQRRVEQLSAAERVARVAAEDADERLAQARGVLAEGSRVD